MADIIEISEPRAFFSQTTPNALRQILNTAIATKDLQHKEQLLEKARSQWPDEPDIHIALYKFLFVSAQYNKAEASVWRALVLAAQKVGFNRNYKRLTAQSADWDNHTGYERLYLFSLKALGVCRLRRGRVLAARSVLSKLHQLDPHDCIGGLAYLHIAEAFFNDE